MAYPEFGRSVNPILTRGTNYAHLITTGTPGFSDPPTALPNGNLLDLEVTWAFSPASPAVLLVL